MSGDPDGPRPLRMNHLAIAVADLDAALAFYRDALGIEAQRVEDVAREDVKVAFLPLRDGEIELLQPTRDDTGVAKWLAKHGPGLHHVCLEVDDLEQALARLASRGAELMNPQPVTREDGTRYAFVHPRSAFGVLVELYEVKAP